MENLPLSYLPIMHLNPESASDAKSRFWPICSHAASKAEIVCPRPHRATRVPYVFDSPNKFGPKAKGLPVRRGYHCMEFLEDLILAKDELEIDSDASNQIGFLRGSPPVRSHNPVVHDAEFKKLNLLPSPPLGNYHGMRSTRHDKGSPSCSSSLLGAGPTVRVEGFACGSSEPCAIPATA